mmetsp:Transcript_3865/g.11181  ORF Transcript_3865/g.11181 Transcript_3865/m.11181 type:complete len:449 (+) Transcript_3865:782-2128(+)
MAMASCCRASCADLTAARSSPLRAVRRSSTLASTLPFTSSGILPSNSFNCFSVWYTRLSAVLRTSISSRFFLSSSENFSASATILSTSSLAKVDAPVILMSVWRPLPLSVADTDRMPLASMSNLTSIWGTPRGAVGMPSNRKLPSDLLSFTNSRSPCSTLISTEVCPSAAVLKVSDLEVGRVVLRGISLVITPPRVSRPRDSGVTSSSTMSDTSPASTPPCTAAPRATTSSGFTDTLGSLPAIFLTRSMTAGMRVEPPTRMTSSSWFSSSLASFSARSTGMRHLSRRSEHICSNWVRLMVASMCLGPSAVAVMKGRLMLVLLRFDSSIFAFSAASVNRCRAWRSLRRSMPSFFLKSSARKSTMRLSKSSPPRWVSPAVDSTSNTPSPTSRTDTSKVPPPRSNTRIVSLVFRSRPYAREAAVGSLMMRSTSSPAMRPASLVACRCESLK